jgi:predicted nucleic acid-binding protein
MNLIIDTNVLIAALIRDGLSRRIIIEADIEFYVAEESLLEIKGHEEAICLKAGINAAILRMTLKTIISHTSIISNSRLLNRWEASKEIIGHIDIGDVYFIAAALLFENSAIWSNDKVLKRQNKIPIYNTKEVLEIINFP